MSPVLGFLAGELLSEAEGHAFGEVQRAASSKAPSLAEAPMGPSSPQLLPRPRLRTAASELSLGGSTSGSPERQRSGTGRFFAEELTCFRRLPTPSLLCGQKAETFWATTSAAAFAQRRTASKGLGDSGLSSLPASKGDPYRLSPERLRGQELLHTSSVAGSECGQQQEPAAALPLEDWTARILEQIYPRSLEGQAGRPSPSRRSGSKRTPTGAAARCGGLAASLAAASGSAPAEAASRSADRHEQRQSAQAKLLRLRQRTLERFPTMKLAFEVFAGVRGLGREFTRKEFNRFLTKQFGALPKEDIAAIFDLLSEDGHEVVTLGQFHTGLEACVPVRCIEDLRRRLIALGHTSMRQVVLQMEDDKHGPSWRLTPSQFASALKAVGVTDEEEHRCLFAALCDPGGPSPAAVSLDELSSALAAVSPYLLLEDLRDRLFKRPGGLAAAWDALGAEAGAALGCSDFAQRAADVWRVTLPEARKAFRLIDAEGRQRVNRRDLLRALSLSEPSLFLEDARRRVRQRFLSIRGALHGDDEQSGVSAGPPRIGERGEAGPHFSLAGFARGGAVHEPRRSPSAGAAAAKDASPKKRTLSDFCAALATVQLPEADTQALFELIDIDHEGKLPTQDFAWGVRLFTPACFLEDLRLRCLRTHGRVADAFVNLPQEVHESTLDVGELGHVLQDLDLQLGVDIEAVLHLIEPRPEGGATIAQLIAAVRSVAPGIQVPLLPEQRNARAQQQVHNEMAPFHRSVRELKADVRQKPKHGLDEHSCILEATLTECECVERATMSPHKKHGKDAQDSPSPCKGSSLSPYKGGSACPGRPGRGDASSTSPPVRREPPSLTHPPLKQSYAKVSQLVKTACSPSLLPASDATPMLERLHGYYTTAGNAVANDVSMLAISQSRLQLFRSASGHRRVLERPLL